MKRRTARLGPLLIPDPPSFAPRFLPGLSLQCRAASGKRQGAAFEASGSVLDRSGQKLVRRVSRLTYSNARHSITMYIGPAREGDDGSAWCACFGDRRRLGALCPD